MWYEFKKPFHHSLALSPGFFRANDPNGPLEYSFKGGCSRNMPVVSFGIWWKPSTKSSWDEILF